MSNKNEELEPKPPRKRKKKEVKKFNLMLPLDLYEELVDNSETIGVSMKSIVVNALRKYFKEN